MSVIEPREPALRRALTDAVEGTEGRVLFVGLAPGQPPEFRAGQADEFVEIPLPEALRSLVVAGLQGADPVGDGSWGSSLMRTSPGPAGAAAPTEDVDCNARARGNHGASPPGKLKELRDLILAAHGEVAQAVNSGQVVLYWLVGHRLRTEVLGAKRAGYGERIVAAVAARLTANSAGASPTRTSGT